MGFLGDLIRLPGEVVGGVVDAVLGQEEDD